MNCTLIEPSPTALATRLIERWRTSPATNTPGSVVSSRNGSRSSGQRCVVGDRGVRPGEDEAALVAADLLADPVRVGRGADEHEHRADVEHLVAVGAGDADVLEALPALGRRDLRARAHLDVPDRGDLLDQVVGHRGGERRAAHEHDHLARAGGEEDRGLAGGVRAADDDHGLVRAGLGLDERGAVVDPLALQLGDPGRVEPPVGDAGGDQHAVAGELAAAGERDDALRSARLELVDLLDRQQLGAEAARLVVRAAGEVGAGEAVREAEVVLDPRALAGLAAGRLALHEHGAQPLGRAVHRRREPGRAAADDDQVVEVELGLGRDAEPRRELERRRRLEHRAVAQEHRGQPVRADAGDVEQPARLGVAVEVEPLVGDPVAGEQVARLVRGGREAVADDPHLGVGARARWPPSRRAGPRASGTAAPPAGPTASGGSSRSARG